MVESWLHSAIGTWLASLTAHGHRRTGTERSIRMLSEVREIGVNRGGEGYKKAYSEFRVGARNGRFLARFGCGYVIHVAHNAWAPQNRH